MFLPPRPRSQHSILVRVRISARGRCRVRARGRGRVRTRLKVGVGVRVRVGFKDSVGVQNGQKFSSGAFGAREVLDAFNAYGLLRPAPLTTNCQPKAT